MTGAALLIAFAAALATTLASTPAVRHLARRVGMLARPSGDRWHRRPTTLLGGVAIYAGFLAGLAAALAVAGDGALAAIRPFGFTGAGILLSSTVMLAVGLADDRLNLRPATKLIFQGVAATVLVSCGVVYPIAPWAAVNVLATMLWFLALTNAVNLLDNMDGVAAGIAGIAAAFLSISFAWEGAWMLAAACLALAGAVFGFLPFNFHRATIFMGDSGSLFVGSVLAGLGAAYPATASTSIISVLFVPVVIVVIPIIDTSLVTLTRTLAGRPVSQGGRDHTSHRLVAMGLSEPQAALLLYGFAAAGGLLAMALRAAAPDVGLWLGSVFLVVLLVLAAYLGRLHSYSPDEPRSSGRVTVLISNLFHKRRALEVVLDLILFAIAYQGAYLLRYDADLPPSQAYLLEHTLALAVASKLVAFGLLGVYRGIWQQLGMADVHRILRATALGSLFTVVAVVFPFRETDFSRSILLMDGLLVALLAVGARASFRSLDRVRHALNDAGEPTLLYGAAQAGVLVARELATNPDLGIRPVGFIDDDPGKRGRLVHGIPVLGGLDDVRDAVARRGVRKLVLCTRTMAPGRVRRLEALCAELRIELLELQLELRSRRAPELPITTHAG